MLNDNKVDILKIIQSVKGEITNRLPHEQEQPSCLIFFDELCSILTRAQDNSSGYQAQTDESSK